MDYPITVTVNGTRRDLKVPAGEIFLHTLRNRLGLVGAKDGCLEGECGACTILVDGEAVRSCLIFAPTMHGRTVTTIEGLGARDRLDAVQQAFLDTWAVQCGFCIPGFILAARALLNENPRPTEAEVREALSGNLCRCTGYTKIVAAVLKAAEAEAVAGGRREA
jgi:aerobic-type carbon monoxide dehydrogenase small subunit (CoxS/CutS family)